MQKIARLWIFAVALAASSCWDWAHADDRPNIVFAIADDWGWPHASIYQNDDVCQTPTFDGIARNGLLFNHAYISSPSCTPSRNAILTGQFHWRLGSGANLWSTLDTKHKTYIVDNRKKDDEHRLKYDLSFGKRPEFELFDLSKDPGQMRNVAGNPDYADTLKKLGAQLTAELTATDDPRVLGQGDETFDPVPYLGGAPKKPKN